MIELPPTLWIFLAVVASVAVVVLLLKFAVWLFTRVALGAICLLAYASESGFIGVTLYVILWVIALPLMLVACAIFGHIRMAIENSSG